MTLFHPACVIHRRVGEWLDWGQEYAFEGTPLDGRVAPKAD